MEQEFLDWFEANEERFAHGQFDDKQIAYSAWLEGKGVVNKNCTIPVVSKSVCPDCGNPKKYEQYRCDKCAQKTY